MAKPEMSGKKGRSGLPEEVIMKDYPKCDYISGEHDDTMTRIDSEKDQMVGKTKKHISNQH